MSKRTKDSGGGGAPAAGAAAVGGGGAAAAGAALGRGGGGGLMQPVTRMASLGGIVKGHTLREVPLHLPSKGSAGARKKAHIQKPHQPGAALVPGRGRLGVDKQAGGTKKKTAVGKGESS